MEDHQKPKHQLLKELAQLRRRLCDLESKNAFSGQSKNPSPAAVWQSELARYRDFVESIEDGCFEVDLEGSVTFANAGMCRTYGYSSEELIGMNHRDFASADEARDGRISSAERSF